MAVRSAERVLELLELMAQQSEAVSLAEIHRMVDLPKSSTLLLVRTLQQRGYVARDGAGAYRLVRLPGEGSADMPAWGTILRLAAPWLGEAVAAVGESGFIAALTRDGHVRYLNKILPTSRELKYDRDITVDRIAHQVASGLVLLAGLPDSRVEAYLAALPAAVDGPDRPEAVRAAIGAVRAGGIAVNLAGRVEGAAGVAVAILDSSGHPVAAVNLAGPADRITSQLPAIKRAAQKAATQIGEALARRTPTSGLARTEAL
jgi:IclR family acetate operon transcriptional repressor